MNRLLTGGLLAVLVYLSGCSAQTASSLVPMSGANARGTLDVLGGAPPKDRRHGEFALFDAPLPNAGASASPAVVIRLLAVSPANGDKPSPWITFSKPQDVDLLQLQQDAATWDGFMAYGQYNAIQLSVDPSHCYVVQGGVKYPMVFNGQPAGAKQVAIKGNVPNFTVGPPSNDAVSGTDDIQVALDFNVFESLKIENGVAKMDPHLSGGAHASQIHGKVVNAENGQVANAAVVLINAGGHMVNSTVTNGGGDFQLNGILPGTYTLHVLNSYTSGSGNSVHAVGNDPNGAVTTTVTINGHDIDLHQLTD
ncbi:MAG: carboxypeptidase regulatory-like domain-containing protein [Candidatus Eremiobacteraeota bacterium]|nr:carboxypeptidase regulatory-like domain-containing protein [Candidatus Eremiobacteraeota bacterium]